LAVRLTATALAVADSNVWPEPSSADPGHGLFRASGMPVHGRPCYVVNFWQVSVGQFSRARKPVGYCKTGGGRRKSIDPVMAPHVGSRDP